MNDFESELKRALADRVEGARPAPLTRRSVLSARLRRSAVVAAGGLGVVTMAIAGFGLVESRLDEDARPASATGSEAHGFEDVQAGGEVASGEHQGARWTLLADRREHATGPVPESLLCVQLDFAGRQGESTCNLHWNAPPTDGFVAPIWYITGRGPVVVYGAVQEPVETVELSVDGHPAPARVYEAPAEFASTLDFFVGFLPPGTDAAHLVVRDAAGNELESRNLGPQPK